MKTANKILLSWQAELLAIYKEQVLRRTDAVLDCPYHLLMSESEPFGPIVSGLL